MNYDPKKRRIIEQLLRRPVAFHPIFARVAGSVAAGVMLAQAYYWQNLNEGHQRDWWWKTRAQWATETALGKNEQITARKKLREIGLLEESFEGIPPKIWFKLNVDRLFELMERALDEDDDEDNSNEVPSVHFPDGRPSTKRTDVRPRSGQIPSTESTSESSSETTRSGEDASAVALPDQGQETGQVRSRVLEPEPEPEQNQEEEDGQEERLLRRPADAQRGPRTNASPGTRSLAQIAALKARQQGVDPETGQRPENVRVRTGGMASERRQKRDRNPMEAALEEDRRADRKANPIREATIRHVPVPDKPERGAPAEEWIAWATDRIRLPKRGRDKGGVRAPEEWTGPDAAQFLSDLVEGVLGQERPDSTPQAEKQAGAMIRSLGGDRTHDLMIYVVSNWERIRAAIPAIQASAPTAALILGFLPSIKEIRAGTWAKRTKGGDGITGADRGKGDYTKMPDEGWG